MENSSGASILNASAKLLNKTARKQLETLISVRVEHKKLLALPKGTLPKGTLPKGTLPKNVTAHKT